MLVIFDTHPIQYRAPVFRHLKRMGVEFHVGLFNETFNGRSWWFNEVGKIPAQPFGLPLTEGYPHTILDTRTIPLLDKTQSFVDFLVEKRATSVLIYGYYQVEHWAIHAACRTLNLPLFFVGETFEDRSGGLRKIVKQHLRDYFFDGVTEFITIGKKNRHYYLSLGVHPDQMTDAHYCVDNDFFTGAPDQRHDWRKKLNFSTHDMVYLYVGRLFSRKRVQDAIHLLKNLPPTVHLVVVGNGEEEQALRKMSDSRIQFLGFQNQRELIACYQGADLLIVPSEFETWGLVVNEAAACGLPSLVTSTCGVANDLVETHHTGLVYEMGNIGEAEKLCREYLSHEKLKRLGNAAHKKVLTKYTPQKFALAIAHVQSKYTLGTLGERPQKIS